MHGALLVRDHGSAEVLQPLLTVIELHVEEVVEEDEDVSLSRLLIDSHLDLLGVRSIGFFVDDLMALPLV